MQYVWNIIFRVIRCFPNMPFHIYTHTVDHHNNPREIRRARIFTSSFYQWEFELKGSDSAKITVSVKTKVKFQVI